MPNELKWEVRELSTYLEDWMLVVILLSLIMVAFVRVKYQESFSTLVSSIFTTNIMTKESAGQIGWTDTEKILLLSVYFLSSSLLYTLLLIHYFPGFVGMTSSIAFFQLFVLIGIASFFIRIGLLSFIELIAGKFSFLTEYSFSIGQSNRFLGLLFIPVCLLIILFTTDQAGVLLSIGLVLFAIIYLLRVFRLVKNSIKIQGGIFYIILYLCTFEFLPFLITFHFVQLILKG